ncbi:serine/threonine protein kinase [Candidatus Obscuribacterales bacterium]|nr:serine/threonine protein kinase [Candidatus Obscuribacterales bacterium]
MSEGANSEQRQEDGQLRNKKPGEALIGKTLFDRYEVLEVLGESAMALVLKAREVGSNRLVAIKTVTPHDPEIVKRFAQEVQLHGSLKHPNIVEAIDCLEAQGGRTFFVMEFMYGASLRHILQDQKRIDNEDDLGSIILQICDALEHAHSSGVLHRDLKPGNIHLLEKDNKLNVKVLDFGIAKPLGQQTGLTQAGYAVGSPLYMSPEQCRGQKVDARSDVYSMGILAYEMTTGNLPYAGHNIMTVMAAHCDPERKPTALSAVVPDLKRVDELNAAIQTSMETDPAKRFQTIAEFRKAIQKWHEGVQADLLSNLVAGQQLNLPAETKHAVAEKALKSAGQSGVDIPQIPREESVMDFSPNSVSTPSTPPASAPAADDVKRMERTLRPGQSPTEKPSPNAVRVNDEEGDRCTARIENVSLSMDEQKGRMRNRFQLPSANSADTDNSKKIIITIGLVLLFLLIALFVMAKALLH